MSLLDGGGAALFGELLAPLYVAATLTSQALTYGTGGSFQRGADPLDCRVQVDRCTERMVQTEGYTDTDQAIYLLAASLEGGEVKTGYDVEVLEGPYAGQVFRLASPIDRDPAGAYWLARGVRQKASSG